MKNKNKKRIIELLKLIIFMFVLALLFYVNKSNNQSIDIEKTNSTLEKKIDNNNTEEKTEIPEISIEHLVGTCPRNRACTIPSCPLWSDLDNDGVCDRAK